MGNVLKNIIGRESEKKKLSKILNSDEAEFLTIYGRRRVGKTFLIHEFFQGRGLYLEVTGQKDAGLKIQLYNFYLAIEEAFKPTLPIKKPDSWKEALSILTTLVEAQPRKKKIILFFDELPWLATKRSAMLQALEYEWNRKWSRTDNIKLIVCGSAASWVLEKLIQAKGGLHNRITDFIHLQPFTLEESSNYLKSRGVKLKPMQILELYMVMGGIPHYLRQVEKGKSSTQIINSLCFHKDGFLFTEFTRLFQSLFNHAEVHNKIICEIGKKRNGILRRDLLEATGYKSGGTFKKRLQELKESGFIQEYVPYGKARKDFTIKIVDEYTLFYLNWIKPVQLRSALRYNPNYWLNISKKSQYQIWAGYAFESVCMKHVDQILKKLKVENLATEIGNWHYLPPKKSKETGAQIDLLIDRIDNSINVCEIKFSNTQYSIDKKYARNLDNKLKVFEEKTGTKKQIFLSMITTMGLKKNFYSEDLVDSEIVLKDLIV
jgi:AAA+ ATPase superfamily predicted ATPase